jgi:hypothetical protein
MMRWLCTLRPREIVYLVGIVEAALIWKVYVG